MVDEEFVPATYLDTDAKFDLPHEWIYEGVLFNKDYSQKKYTFSKNLDVSILYGMKNLKDEIKKKVPFIPADSILDSLSDEDIVSILGSASKSTIEEKMYGSNKFYEFSKNQKVENGTSTIDVNCIVDLLIDGDNIFSFSYIYKDEKDGLIDYGNALTSFVIKGNEEKDDAVLEPIIDEITTENEVANEFVEEIQNETKKEEIIEEKEVKEETIEKTEFLSGENALNIEDIIEIENNNLLSGNDQEKSLKQDFETMSVVKKTYEPQTMTKSTFSIVLHNPVILIAICVFVIVDIIIFKIIKNKRKK